jgi:class 3 adenylate cyclase
MPAPTVVTRTVSLDAEASQLWHVITDTERLNRAIGMGSIELIPNHDDSAARYLVRTVSAGFPLEYEERPYEWRENQHYRVMRKVRKGAVHSIENAFELTPREGGGTDITIRITVEPRMRLMSPVLRAQISRSLGRLCEEMQHIDRELAASGAASYRAPATGVDKRALAAAAERLRAAAGAELRPEVEALVDAVAHDPDDAVDRLRPFELAAERNVRERAMLRACLHAVVSGLLELSWDLVCPSCITSSERLPDLADIGDGGHCHLCEINFELGLDEAVEATFRPTAKVRKIDAGPYCIGGPARTPHVIEQAILPEGGSATVHAPAEKGDYRVFVRGGISIPLEVHEDGDGDAKLSLNVDDDPPSLRLAPDATVTLRHPGTSERHVKLERSGWRTRAATADIVTTLSDFRHLFSSQVLRPGIGLRVGRTTLLFTDLTGSTRLYSREGDATAFRIVQDHFELLAGTIEAHDGTVIKTIGDATMAAFVDERDALLAALAMQGELEAFRDEHPAASDCRMRVGVHAGPCFAVTANNVLDYFGQTVNVAARLEACARGGEVVMTAELADRARSEGWLSLEGERLETELKGVGKLLIERIRIDSEEPPNP